MKTFCPPWGRACSLLVQQIPLLRRLVVLWLLALCLGSFNGLLAQPAFFRKDIFVGLQPSAVIPGDFNGDGRTDLAVSTEEGLFVLLNSGGGKFQRPIRTEASSLAGFFWLAVSADFNGDGKDDLVGSGLLFLSRGDGTFLPPRPVGDQEAVAAADFNGDGKMDLLIADSSWGSGGLTTRGVRVLLGNGDGTFQSGAMVSALAAVQVRVADFNRDGRPDVAFLPMPGTYPGLAPSGSTTLLVFLGQGDGTFGPEIRTPFQGAPDSSSYSFLVANFNGDKLPDVFTAGGIALGKGDGSFQALIPYVSNVRGFPMAAADFTGDGYADLIMTYYSDNSIGICSGRGDGTLSQPVAQSIARGSGYSAGLTAPVDLDGDGRLDLVSANYLPNTVSVLLGRAQWQPAMRRAVSAAIDLAIVAPGSLATLFAPASSTGSASATPPWPTSLGGISLEVRDSAGATHLAPLLYVSPTQINFRVPAGTALGEATLAIVGDSGTAEAGSMQVEAVAPGFFTADGWPMFTAVMVEPDGTQVPVAAEPIPLSTAGDRPIYLSFFGTGFAGANTDNVTVSINGTRVPVVYAGPQETPGVDQINIRLVPEVLGTMNCVEFWGCEGPAVSIRIGGVPANSLWLWVE
jgi:uncharacterized protein (TIGR03437 family)